MNEQDQTQADVIQAEVVPVVASALSLVISTPDDYAAAAESLKSVKGAQKRVDAELIEPWRKVKANAAENMKKWSDLLIVPLEKAEAILKKKQLTYQAEQEAIRQAEQRKLQAAADEAARKERERLEKEAAKLKTPELREARLEQAAAVIAPVVTVAAVTPVIAGQSVRRTWKARVVNAALLPREYTLPNQQALDAFAKATKGAIPLSGVEFYEESTLASSSR